MQLDPHRVEVVFMHTVRCVSSFQTNDFFTTVLTPLESHPDQEKLVARVDTRLLIT